MLRQGTRNSRNHGFWITRNLCVGYIQSSPIHTECMENPCDKGIADTVVQITFCLSTQVPSLSHPYLRLLPFCVPWLLQLLIFSFVGLQSLVTVQYLGPKPCLFVHDKYKTAVSSFSILEHYIPDPATRENVALHLFELASAGQQSCLWKTRDKITKQPFRNYHSSLERHANMACEKNICWVLDRQGE